MASAEAKKGPDWFLLTDSPVAIETCSLSHLAMVSWVLELEAQLERRKNSRVGISHKKMKKKVRQNIQLRA